jgi:hypothetical protein
MNNDRNHASTGRGLRETGIGASARASIDCGGVLNHDTTRQPKTKSNIRALVLLVFVLGASAFAAASFSKSIQGADFPDFYCAARMVADGQGHQLYDAALQRQYQARYAGRVGTLYIHPPFETVLYLSVAWLPLLPAYLLWCLLNIGFLALALRRLTTDLLNPWHWSIFLAASLTFVPVLLCLQQGQDSILLLLLVVLGFTALHSSRAFAAGCLLALGLFKFQIVLPLIFVLFVRAGSKARAKLAKGFALVALALAGLSAAICGWSVFSAYPKFLLDLRTQQYAGVVPQGMANFRGLVFLLSRSERSGWAIVTLTVLSVAALIQTLFAWDGIGLSRNPAGTNLRELDLSFATSLLFALLVSYHLNPHDLSLALLPISLCGSYAFAEHLAITRNEKRITLALLALLFLPPLHIVALRAGFYELVGIPLIALFLLSTFFLRRGQAA